MYRTLIKILQPTRYRRHVRL